MKKWIMTILLRWHKQKVLLEVRKDIEFLETFKHDLIHFDETDARNQLSEIRNSEGLTAQEKAQRCEPIEKLINEAIAYKINYEKSLELEKDVTDQLTII